MSLFSPSLFSLCQREKGLGGLLEKSPGESFPVIKPAPAPPPGQLQSLLPGTVLTSLEETPLYKQ